MIHVELIDPREKLSRDLGGLGGYASPKQPAPFVQLITDAECCAKAALPICVWKVARRSVDWHKGPWRDRRILNVEGHKFTGTILGGIRDWYFVSVEAADVLRAAKREAHV